MLLMLLTKLSWLGKICRNQKEQEHTVLGILTQVMRLSSELVHMKGQAWAATVEQFTQS